MRVGEGIAGGDRLGTRAVVLAFLGTLAVARSFDAVDHGGPGYLPFVVALFVLPVWMASGVARDRWHRLRWWLLALQAVLTYVPFAVFGSGWVGGVSGLLAGLVLLTVSAPWSWLAFGVLLAVEELLWLGVGLPYEPAVNSALWVLIAFTDVGLALFGLTRLAELVREVDATRDEVTVAAVARQRLVVADRLRSAIGDRLQVVEAHASAALRTLGANPDEARREMADAGTTARDVLTEARALAADDSDPDQHPGGVVVAPRLARTVLLVVVVVFATQNLLNVAAPVGVDAYPPVTIAVAVFVSVAITILQVRHSGAQHDGVRPPGWRWTFAAQVVLSYVQVPFSEGIGTIFLPFLAGSALLLFVGWRRWLLYGVIIASQFALSLLFPGEIGVTDDLVRWSAYATAISAAYGLMVYGLSRFAGLAVRLAVLRAELAELAAVRERLRLARDTHDLLGLGLAIVALKTDLVAALIGRDEARARHELGELLRICVTARTDVQLIAGERLRLSFDTELRLARDILTSSGIAVDLPDPPPRAPEHVDAVLATVVREAVTNILRHSTARRCEIALAVEDGVLTLRIRNDGATNGTGSPGRGLANLGDRVESVDGRFTARRTGAEFELLAEFPAQQVS